MSCIHDRRRITWTDADGRAREAVQTPSGAWVYIPWPGRMERVTHCPGCGVELWGRPDVDRRPIPAQAHARRRGYRPNESPTHPRREPKAVHLLKHDRGRSP